MKKLLILLFVMGVSVGVILANGVDDRGEVNDPAVNDRANACYEGGSMADASCASEWEWTCGWHLIRWEANNTYAMPSSCQSLLPQVTNVIVTGPPACSSSRPDYYGAPFDAVEDVDIVATISSPTYTSPCGDTMTYSAATTNAYEQSPGLFVCDVAGNPYEVRITWSGSSGSFNDIFSGNCTV